MFTKRHVFRVFLLVTVLLCCCDDSGDCPCVPERIDPPISSLSVVWKEGYIWADLMPAVPPDPIMCSVWLILENKDPLEAFSRVEIPRANVILAELDSTLGAIPIDTYWDGCLAPGKSDTVLFFKNVGQGEIFDPPCGKRVLLDFIIRNADGDSTVFRPDTLLFVCAF